MGFLYIGKQKLTPVLGGERYTNVKISSTSATIALSTYTIYSANVLNTLNITPPLSPNAEFIAQLDFTSGSTPTVVNSNNIEWFGDNVNEVQGFLPRSNCDYSIIFYYTGTTVRGVIQGSEL